MKCSKCGEEVSENQGFCLKCGNPITVAPDLNSIENELASNISELLEEELQNDDLNENDDVDEMVTIDVPYDEIDMELKMMDLSRNQSPERIRVKNNSNNKPEEREAPIRGNDKNSEQKASTKAKREAEALKAKKKKRLIILTIIGLVAVAALVISGVFFVKDFMDKRTYDGNIVRAQEAFENEEYDNAEEYANKAVSLASSNIENIKARTIIYNVYVAKGIYDDRYADNIRQMILEGETSEGFYVALVKYYSENEQYSKINDILLDVNDDKIFDALKDYIPAPPVAEQESGDYAGYIVVKLSAEKDCSIYYMRNTDNKLNKGVSYNSGVKIVEDGKQIITCYSVDKNGVESKRVSYEYQIVQGDLSNPVVSPESGTYSKATDIVVEVPKGSKAYFTTDGTDPSSESEEYTEPIVMPRGQSKYKFIIYDEFGLPSGITTVSYNLSILRIVTINDANDIVVAKLIEDEEMNEKFETEFGKIKVTYEQVGYVDSDEFYIFSVVEKNSDGDILQDYIVGINTATSELTDEIKYEDGKFVLPEKEEETDENGNPVKQEETTTASN